MPKPAPQPSSSTRTRSGAHELPIRRDQSPDRARAPIVGWDKKFNLVKVSPLANWTKQKVWGFITQHDIPYNPLHDQGYTSIGCWPCTRAVLQGEDERAGRWRVLHHSTTAMTPHVPGLHPPRTMQEAAEGEIEISKRASV